MLAQSVPRLIAPGWSIRSGSLGRDVTGSTPNALDSISAHHSFDGLGGG